MHDVILIPVERIIQAILDALYFAWGWVISGAVAKGLIQFVAVYYGKKLMDKEESKVRIWTQHFLENHPGHRPSQCGADKCLRLS